MAVYELAEWKFVACASQLTSAAQTRTLTPQHLSTLLAFINAPQQTLSKDALLAQVWQGKVVSDDAITRLISDLRKQLKLDGSSIQYIKTLHGFGYKLEVKVQKQPEALEQVNIATAAKKDRSTRIFPYKLAALVVISSLILLTIIALAPSYFCGQQALQARKDRTLSHWPVTLETAHIDLLADVNYIASGIQQALIYQKSTPNGSSVYSQVKDKSTRLFQVKGKIKNLISSPDGQSLAFVVEQEQCRIALYSLTSKKISTLANCQLSTQYALSWQDNQQLLFANQAKAQQFDLYQLSNTQRPVISRITLPGCHQIKQVYKPSQGHRYISCQLERGDGLFIESAKGFELALKYRSIKNFVVDSKSIVYMTHEPSWKTGITRFDAKLDRISFANTGWIDDIKLQKNKLVLVRDLKNTDLLGFNLTDLSPTIVESSKVQSNAFSLDKISGKLWQLDNRGGPFALYQAQQRILWDHQLAVDLSAVVAMQVAENSGWLVLTTKVNARFVHHLLDLKLNKQPVAQSKTQPRQTSSSASIAPHRQFESHSAQLVINNNQVFFKQLNGQVGLYDINLGQQLGTALTPFSASSQLACLGSPLIHQSSDIRVFSQNLTTIFQQINHDPAIKVRQWQDKRLVSPCGLRQLTLDKNNNRLLYLTESSKYRDVSFISLNNNTLN
jgi:DNA-binding winged helix-turn-helix (wHTH) protein